MTKLTPTQLKRYRFFRDKGFTIKEARRVVRLTYSQLANELSQRLREMSKRDVVRHRKITNRRP